MNIGTAKKIQRLLNEREYKEKQLEIIQRIQCNNPEKEYLKMEPWMLILISEKINEDILRIKEDIKEM